MTPNDIVVGKTYKKRNDPSNVIYLGIGDREMWRNNLTNTAPMLKKHLVVIKGPKEFIGLILKEGNDVQPLIWEMMEPTEDNNHLTFIE